MRDAAARARMVARLNEEFTKHFGEGPRTVVRAPGRVNLIGEHTDYNAGFVLPMAIERAAWLAVRPRFDRRVHIVSLDFEQEHEFDLDGLQGGGREWYDYVRGVAWAMQQAGYKISGFDGVLVGDVPIGAGLSSSAAVEIATAGAIAELCNLPWDAKGMALLAQKAENEWVGVNCGIMDQMISAVGRKGHAVLIDCRTLTSRAVPLPQGTLVVILDTTTRRGLVDSAYNERRRQCETAARFFGVAALRDVSLAYFRKREAELESVTAKRARHVITEIARTLSAGDAMTRGDAAELGRLMQDSHTSLRDDFEVSSAELDVMVEIAQRQRGCLGARMTGAGFGGCAVALVTEDDVPAFVQRVTAEYAAATGLDPNVYVSAAGAGVGTHGAGRSLPPTTTTT